MITVEYVVSLRGTALVKQASIYQQEKISQVYSSNTKLQLILVLSLSLIHSVNMASYKHVHTSNHNVPLKTWLSVSEGLTEVGTS